METRKPRQWPPRHLRPFPKYWLTHAFHSRASVPSANRGQTPGRVTSMGQRVQTRYLLIVNRIRPILLRSARYPLIAHPGPNLCLRSVYAAFSKLRRAPLMTEVNAWTRVAQWRMRMKTPPPHNLACTIRHQVWQQPPPLPNPNGIFSVLWLPCSPSLSSSLCLALRLLRGARRLLVGLMGHHRPPAVSPTLGRLLLYPSKKTPAHAKSTSWTMVDPGLKKRVCLDQQET